MLINCAIFTAVPDKPKSVEMTTCTPTTVTLSVTTPEEDGGMKVTRYRVDVEVDGKVFIFGLGKYSLLIVLNTYSCSFYTLLLCVCQIIFH